MPVMISSNTGPSEIIDPYGRIKASVPNLFTEGVAIAEVTSGYDPTFYTRFGDLFVYFCMIIVLISISLGVLRKR
jgi:apolipoprotein N-acyltransferase